MKRVMLGIIVCVAMMFSGAGCEEGFTPEALTAQIEVLQLQVDEAQAVAVEVAKEIQAAEIVDADAIARLAEINEEVDRVQAQLDVLTRALKGVPITGDAAQDFISQLQAANTASSGLNPYAVPIGAGLSGLSLVLAWLRKREADEAARQKLKYQAHKQGVEKTMKEVSASSDSSVVAIEAKLFTNIGDARADLGVV